MALLHYSCLAAPANTGQSTSTADENHSVGCKFYILSFHQVPPTPVMSTDVSQVGVTLFPY